MTTVQGLRAQIERVERQLRRERALRVSKESSEGRILRERPKIKQD
jgi:hypothetical protein